jgi:hypothetical protein
MITARDIVSLLRIIDLIFMKKWADNAINTPMTGNRYLPVFP